MILVLLGAAVAAWPSSRTVLTLRRRVFRVPLRFVGGPVALLAGWWTGGWQAAIAGAAVAATSAFLWWRGAVAQRESRLRRQLADAIEVVVGELRTGASPTAACAAAGEECTGEVERVFAGAASRSRLGGSCSSSFIAESNWPGGDLQRLGAAWRLAEQHGIPVAEVLDAARRDVTGRLRFDATVHSSLAGPRATSMVLSGLPLFGIVLGEAMGAQPVAVLFGGGFGGGLLLLGSAFACAGLLWAHAITSGVRA